MKSKTTRHGIICQQSVLQLMVKISHSNVTTKWYNIPHTSLYLNSNNELEPANN